MRLTFCTLLAASILLTGCKHCVLFVLHPINQTFARHSNPIAGWKRLYSRDYEKLDKVISDDYRDFIQELPTKARNGIGPIQFYEDRTGQHAVAIETGWSGTDWTYVLIYDKNNKRVRVVKYVSGYYMS